MKYYYYYCSVDGYGYERGLFFLFLLLGWNEDMKKTRRGHSGRFNLVSSLDFFLRELILIFETIKKSKNILINGFMFPLEYLVFLFSFLFMTEW